MDIPTQEQYAYSVWPEYQWSQHETYHVEEEQLPLSHTSHQPVIIRQVLGIKE